MDNYTATDLAKLFDCSVQYISQLHKDEGMPKETDGKYSLDVVVPWYVNHLKKKAANKKDAEALAKIRMAEAKASLAEIELKSKEQSLITVEEAIDVLGNSLSAMRSQLLALPSRVAPQVYMLTTAAEVEGELKKFMSEFLHELSVIPEQLRSLEDVEETEHDANQPISNPETTEVTS